MVIKTVETRSENGLKEMIFIREKIKATSKSPNR
jgi:hypothetical protein